MTIALRQSWFMTVRHLRALWRQPAWIVVTLIQPIIWLLLYGALFKRVVEIPGFKGGSYIEFLTPGVIVMTAFFSAGWSGMPVIEDIERGVVDRFLITPTRRTSLVAGRIAQGSISVAVQSIIIVVLALIVGGSFRNGVGGIALMIFLAVLLSAAVTAWSYGVALLVRKEETLIALMQFLLLPLTFLSEAFMQAEPRARVDPPHRGLQPAQLGGGGRALGGDGAHGLGLRRVANRLPAGAARADARVRHAGVQELSAVDSSSVLSPQSSVGLHGRRGRSLGAHAFQCRSSCPPA